MDGPMSLADDSPRLHSCLGSRVGTVVCLNVRLSARPSVPPSRLIDLWDKELVDVLC